MRIKKETTFGLLGIRPKQIFEHRILCCVGMLRHFAIRLNAVDVG